MAWTIARFYLNKQSITRSQLREVPRVGDKVRLSSFSGPRTYVVEEVVWCYDEDNTQFTKVDIFLSKIEKV